jgi:single-stranded-DNA-specific exonuclease
MKRDLEKIWQVAALIPQEAANQLRAYSLVMRQLLYNRGIQTAEEARVYLERQGSLYNPFEMIGMESGVDRIVRAIANGERIAVYGDYDVDGVTATVLMVQVLRCLGGKAFPYIPDRFEEGYGLNNAALDLLAADGFQLIVTVDCGIRSLAEADYAHNKGMDLIISDHHEPKLELPAALAVINPRQAGDTYPEKNLAGVGVAFKIAQALFERFPGNAEKAEDWLDLVAVGTVADIVPLSGENRTLVKAGMELLRRGRRQGLKSLVGAAGFESSDNLSARDIGFMLGPRLNAAGRLDSAMAAFDLLMALDPNESGPLALSLDDQNRQRQLLTASMQVEAEALFSEDEATPFLIFAFKPEFDYTKTGLVGLVASRLTETYYRPSIVACQENGFVRASCRSIPEFNITQALDQCSKLLVRHGGHAMAAGFTVRRENLDELVENLNAIALSELGHRVLRPVLNADLEIPLHQLRPDILKDLDRLEPTGLGNHSAYFISRNLQIKRTYLMGKENQHLKLVVADDRNVTYDAVAFRMGHRVKDLPARIDLLYAFERNVYRGRETMQLMVRDIRPSNGIEMEF